jgi:hypothetical protein
LAREFRYISPNCNYLAVEIDAEYSHLAKRYCDECILIDIEAASEEFWIERCDRDCWIFGDALEHLRDPWMLLKRIRGVIPKDGCVVACIPNAQHWSLQVKLGIGEFRYESHGLLDRTHLRWFTRKTMTEMFEQADFKIMEIRPRIFDEPQREMFLPLIERMARRAGADARQAVSDSLPLQYVLRAIPNY